MGSDISYLACVWHLTANIHYGGGMGGPEWERV